MSCRESDDEERDGRLIQQAAIWSACEGCTWYFGGQEFYFIACREMWSRQSTAVEASSPSPVSRVMLDVDADADVDVDRSPSHHSIPLTVGMGAYGRDCTAKGGRARS